MLNGIFVFVVLTSVLAAALSGEMQALTDAVIASARNAVDLAIGLVGVMAFFLGLMRVASDAGLMARLARLVSPVMRLLFPALPADSPAISAMLLNISANMLGLANAATPFGIKAIEELDKHNGRRGTATGRHGAVSGHQHVRAGPHPERHDRHPRVARLVRTRPASS